MGIAENVDTIYDYFNVTGDNWLLDWITTVAESPNPSQVYSMSYTSYEFTYATSYLTAFDNEAIKLGVMGTTILASSGDNGVAGTLATNDPYYCGYSPGFPASSPYVVCVGGTNVSTAKPLLLLLLLPLTPLLPLLLIPLLLLLLLLLLPR